MNETELKEHFLKCGPETQEAANKRNAPFVKTLLVNQKPFTAAELRFIGTRKFLTNEAFALRGISRTLTLQTFKPPPPARGMHGLFRVKCQCGKVSKPFKLKEPKPTRGWVSIPDSGCAPIPHWELEPEYVKFKRHKCKSD